MKPETKLKKQLENCKKWVRDSRTSNEPYFLGDHGRLMMQVALEQIVNYLEMKEHYAAEIQKN